jgi:hypothetical protein
MSTNDMKIHKVENRSDRRGCVRVEKKRVGVYDMYRADILVSGKNGVEQLSVQFRVIPGDNELLQELFMESFASLLDGVGEFSCPPIPTETDTKFDLYEVWR